MAQEKVHYRARIYRSYVSSYLQAHRHLTPDQFERDKRLYAALYARYLPPSKYASILEVGCGTGSFIAFLQERGYQRVLGLDLGEEQIAVAKRFGVDNVQLGDALEYLPSHTEEFDMIVAFDLIEHLTKDEVLRFLDLAYRALRPGGRLLLRTPNGDSPLFGWIRYGDFTHEQAFTPSSIRQVLHVVGFRAVRIYPLEPWVHGTASAVRWALWKMMKQAIRLYYLVEQGTMGSGVFTANLLAVAERP